MKNGLIIDENGTKRYFRNDELHREECPAVEWIDGTKFWYVNGKQTHSKMPAPKKNK